MIITMGFDLAKNIFLTFFQRMGQTKMAMLSWSSPRLHASNFWRLSSTSLCLIGMEARTGAHH